MLNIYIGKTNKDIELYNDSWFNINVSNIDFTNTQINNIIKHVDNTEYVKNNKIKSKFIRGTLAHVNELSSGCKTVINVVSFQDKLFTIAECGNNAIKELFIQNIGNIYVPYGMVIPDLNININLIFNGKSYNISDRLKLSTIINNYFRGKSNDT